MTKLSTVGAIILVGLVLVSSFPLGCAKPTPAPTPPPSPKPTVAPAPSPSLSPSPKPTAAPAPKETAEAFYKGKRGEIIVGYAPGGTFDLVARALAPELEKLTGAQWLVVNKAGGSGVAGCNYLVNTAKADGLAIFINAATGPVVAQLTGSPEVHYDLKKINFLASVSYGYQTFFINARLPYKTIGEMVASGKTFKFAAAGRSSTSCWLPQLAFTPLGMKVQPIPGYKGSADMVLGVVQGESDGAILTHEQEIISHEKAGELRFMYMLTRERYSKAPDVPTIFEVTLPKESRSWFEMFADQLKAQRGIMAAPGVPQDRVDFLKAALKKCMENKEFFAQLEKMDAGPAYTSGEELRDIYLAWLNLSPEKIEALKAAALEKK